MTGSGGSRFDWPATVVFTWPVLASTKATMKLSGPGAPVDGPPGAPVRLEGREAIRAYSRQVMATALRLEAYEVTELHQTQDPAVVIAEMRAQATLADGQAMTATSIQVLRIQDGRIALVRDFADPRILDKVIPG